MTTMTGPESRRVPDDGVSARASGAAAMRREPWRLWRVALPDALPDSVARFLAVPLSAKLAGTNVTIVIAALGVALFTHRGTPEDGELLALMTIALGVSLAVSVGLVLAALRPLHYLEQAAEQVSSGNLAARVPSSPLADRNIARIGRTFNRVLEDLIADRARARRLAREVIRAGDLQRAHIGRELNESTAQVLAALSFQASALASISTDQEVTERLDTIRGLTAQALDQVGMIAQTIHPRVLDDLGPVVALKGLARRVRETTPVEADVYADLGEAELTHWQAAMVYRVAEEAVANAVRHGSAQRVCIRLTGTASGVRLAISDDGRGFVVEAARSGPGLGLFMMQERASLAGATFAIDSGPATGTLVEVVLPLRTGPES
ncbi:MAG: ATP-binding protein [Gemmatimonadaceae bacterium]